MGSAIWRAAEHVGAAQSALVRDRCGVPGHLADAAGELLAVRAAATGRADEAS